MAQSWKWQLTPVHFHVSHQVLGCSSCLRSPTNRHAVVLPFSPDSPCHSWFYCSLTNATSIALRTRTNALSVCGVSNSMTIVLWTGTTPLNCTRRFSVSDPTRPRRLVFIVVLFVESFCKKVESKEDLHGTQSFFFWAHAVHARGSDGHQNVLPLISYSHILENRWKQKARCLPITNKTNQTKQNQNNRRRHPGN